PHDVPATARRYRRFQNAVPAGTSDVELGRETLHAAVDVAWCELQIDHSEIVVGAVHRDLSHLSKIPDVRHAQPFPVFARPGNSLGSPLGLLGIVNATPDQLLDIEVLGGGVPAILVEPDRLVTVTIAFGYLAQEFHAAHVQPVQGWRRVVAISQTVGV